MDIGSVSLLIVAAMSILLLLGVPVAFVSGAIAVVLAYANFGTAGFFLISTRTAEFVGSFELIAVPMFVLMASIMEKSGVARDLYRAFHVWAGSVRGGIGVVTTGVAVLLGATTGIIGGEIVLLGLIALPQMLNLGYDRKLAIGTITAGGSLGTMIPPSIILIFYGLTAEVSISHLFLATLVPGLMLASFYVAYILIRCGLDPTLGPPLPPEERDMPLGQKLALFKGVALPMAVAGGVLVSIYAGFASITESAALGAFGAAIAAWVRNEFSFTMLREVLVQALRTCGMVFWLVFGTNALIGVYNLMGGITFASEMLAGVSQDPAVTLSVMIGVFVLLGFFIDWIGILFLTMPIFLPVLTQLGYDPIWFGIVFNLSMQIAYLTPPFGPACFYLKGAAGDTLQLSEIFAAQWPFIGLQIIALVIVVMWPDLSLWLPKLVYG
ncbi:TRAP transporter large permease subunit [Roseobacter sp. YSTF-M11]|uniref:TRAP transporter large permease protein n=1 Tax=Roseobacter insulae TaxID=2859783 RepID=A0A9X1FRM9_9RHOB|nr:TRAP transporter large permease subunit [Roseobacter insulae]MBW4706316.1 TRAP transporter large permease subunit [Roseobacter insulae]